MDEQNINKKKENGLLVKSKVINSLFHRHPSKDSLLGELCSTQIGRPSCDVVLSSNFSWIYGEGI